MTAPAAERNFPVFSRGDLRDELMASWRIYLRKLLNPETGLAFTETEIAVATADDSRWWAEADAIDLILMTRQQQGLYFADQVRIDRAATSWLRGYHGDLWKQGPLPASGGSGPANAPANVGTVFLGSTTVPDPTAHYAVDPAGLRYQVLSTVVTPGTGIAALTFKGIDTGTQTNIAAGTKLKWVFGPLGASGDVTVTSTFTGGTPEETDPEYGRRLKSRVRHKPAAGNQAHFRAWARDSNNAIEDAFVYPCAQHAGSVLVCVTQKRSSTVGPLARIPSVGTLTAATIYLTPPASPVVPVPPHVVIVGPVSQQSDLLLTLTMTKGASSGWRDLQPWPNTSGGAAAYVSAITSQTNFQITIPGGTSGPPAGVTAPSLMVWDLATSRFESLFVQSVTFVGGLTYQVLLTQAPTHTIAPLDVISPDTARRLIVAQTIESYFDSLGPGEVVDLVNDTRGGRAMRFPTPSEEWPQRAGAAVISALQDALGSSLADSTLATITVSTPSIPADPTAGPNMLTLGNIAIYST